MNAYAEWTRFRVAWLAWSVQGFFRDMWDAIPGPRPVKIAIMSVLVACLLIPGPLDEMGVILAIRGLAWLRRRRLAKVS